ncbi:unnamed protein product, partial [marine sediment metagenome]
LGQAESFGLIGRVEGIVQGEDYVLAFGPVGPVLRPLQRGLPWQSQRPGDF